MSEQDRKVWTPTEMPIDDLGWRCGRRISGADIVHVLGTTSDPDKDWYSHCKPCVDGKGPALMSEADILDLLACIPTTASLPDADWE